MMKYDEIILSITKIIEGRYELQREDTLKGELLSLAGDEVKHKEILRIRRSGLQADLWKTIVIVEIEGDEQKDIKINLREAMTWVSVIKESLIGSENSDLYLFLAFSHDVDVEECIRIESTEQFCRKYVWSSRESVLDFINRTFLQELVHHAEATVGEDPLERAFSETAMKFEWLTPEIQKKWKDAFVNCNGSDLIDALLEDVVTE